MQQALVASFSAIICLRQKPRHYDREPLRRAATEALAGLPPRSRPRHGPPRDRAGVARMPHSSAHRQSTVGVVERTRRGGSHRGSPFPVLSAELATSRIPTSCFARAVVSTRTPGGWFAPALAVSHARSSRFAFGAGGLAFLEPEIQCDTRSR